MKWWSFQWYFSPLRLKRLNREKRKKVKNWYLLRAWDLVHTCNKCKEGNHKKVFHDIQFLWMYILQKRLMFNRYGLTKKRWASKKETRILNTKMLLWSLTYTHIFQTIGINSKCTKLAKRVFDDDFICPFFFFYGTAFW